MPRAEYKTIIATRPVVAKIEEYKTEKSLPSTSQALAAMASEVESNEKLIILLNELLKKVREDLQQMKTGAGTRSRKAVEKLLQLINTILEAITLSKADDGLVLVGGVLLLSKIQNLETENSILNSRLIASENEKEMLRRKLVQREAELEQLREKTKE